MADWNTHLYCANKVNKKLNFEGTDSTLFLYGNLLPDINPGWLFKTDVHVDHTVTHFYDKDLGPEYYWAPYRFYAKYEHEIKAENPLFLGYLFHLWLDISIMTEFMSRVSMSLQISHGPEVREWKWKELRIFIQKHPQTLSSENLSAVAEASKGIQEIALSESDLAQVAPYLSVDMNDRVEGDYHIFDDALLEAVYEKICQDFISWVNNM